jgi:hypothetical protein
MLDRHVIVIDIMLLHHRPLLASYLSRVSRERDKVHDLPPQLEVATDSTSLSGVMSSVADPLKKVSHRITNVDVDSYHLRCASSEDSKLLSEGCRIKEPLEPLVALRDGEYLSTPSDMSGDANLAPLSSGEYPRDEGGEDVVSRSSNGLV